MQFLCYNPKYKQLMKIGSDEAYIMISSTPLSKPFIHQLEDVLINTVKNAEISLGQKTGISFGQHDGSDEAKSKSLQITITDRTQYDAIKAILTKLNLIDDIESKDTESYQITITSEKLEAALSKSSETEKRLLFQKMKHELISEVTKCLPKPLARDVIRTFSNLLGAEDVDDVYGFTYDSKLEGASVFNTFNHLSNEFISYVETASVNEQKDMTFLNPIVEGFERYSPTNRLITFPEGLTPLPIDYGTKTDTGSPSGHAVSLGILRKGENYFLVYTNTGGDSSPTTPGTFTFQISQEKVTDLLNPSPQPEKKFRTAQYFYNGIYGLIWNKEHKVFQVENYNTLKSILGRFFLSPEQLNLITGDKKITEANVIDNANGIYAIDDAQAIYQHSKQQEHGNCTISNNRKQIKAYINFCIACRDNVTVTYETLKSQLADRMVPNEIQGIYKDFTQRFLRNRGVEQLINYIKEIYQNPKNFGTEEEVEEIKNTLQHLVAFYIIQHGDRPKDSERIKALTNGLKDLEDFSEKVKKISDKYLKTKFSNEILTLRKFKKYFPFAIDEINFLISRFKKLQNEEKITKRQYDVLANWFDNSSLKMIAHPELVEAFKNFSTALRKMEGVKPSDFDFLASQEIKESSQPKSKNQTMTGQNQSFIVNTLAIESPSTIDKPEEKKETFTQKSEHPKEEEKEPSKKIDLSKMLFPVLCQQVWKPEVKNQDIINEAISRFESKQVQKYQITNLLATMVDRDQLTVPEMFRPQRDNKGIQELMSQIRRIIKHIQKLGETPSKKRERVNAELIGFLNKKSENLDILIKECKNDKQAENLTEQALLVLKCKSVLIATPKQTKSFGGLFTRPKKIDQFTDTSLEHVSKLVEEKSQATLRKSSIG